MYSPTSHQLPTTGATLRGVREGSGLTLESLAERTGTTKSTLSRFERGERTLSADLLARILRTIADEVIAKRAAA